MAKSKLVKTNERIAEKVVGIYQKIEDTVVGGIGAHTAQNQNKRHQDVLGYLEQLDKSLDSKELDYQHEKTAQHAGRKYTVHHICVFDKKQWAC